MKKFLYVLLFLFLSISAFSYPAEDIYSVNGKDYFPEVQKLIKQAKKSIYVSLYIAMYSPNKSDSLPNQLIKELIEAKKRGLDVKVILDQERVRGRKSQVNDLAYFCLKDGGVDVKYDIPSKKLHDKFIIIDDEVTVLGSHNWSVLALEENSETSVVIKSPQLAKDYINWFNSTNLSERRALPPETEISGIFLPNAFVTDPRLGIELGKQRMDFYLYLLREWERTGHRTIVLDFEVAAKFLGKEKHPRHYYRAEISAILKPLQEKYKLISFKFYRDKPAEINLLDLNDPEKLLNAGVNDSFFIPGSFWEFDWLRRLTASEKVFYFICLIEGRQTTDPDGWWSRSHKYLDRKYHIGDYTVTRAVTAFRKYNILKIEYEQWVPKTREIVAPPKYKILPLYSLEWHKKQLENLKYIYGKEKVEKARKWAGTILEENNLDVLEKLINYSDLYGDRAVQYAVNRVLGKSMASPKRGFAYIRAIILGEAKEKEAKEKI